jgi:outer membrane protein OmpA-like peptidoglycan-associated protein
MIRLSFICFLLSCTVTFAQFGVDTNYSRWRVGTMVNFGYNMHSADFGALPDVPNCCPRFNDGSSTSMSHITQIQYRYDQNFTVGLRVGLFEQPTILKAQQFSLANVSGQLREVEIAYEIDANLQTIAAQPFISYHITDPFQIKAGLWGGFLSTKQFSQKEELVQPETGTFENGRRIRFEQSGEIQRTSTLMLGTVAGLSYDLALNSTKTLLLVPEISVQYNLNSFIQTDSWKATTVWAGISALYNFRSEPYVPPPPAPPPAIAIVQKKPDPPKTTIKLFALESLDPSKEPKEIKVIPITQEVTRTLLPLLPYIFFDEGSETLPRRYTKSSSEYSNTAIDKYEKILNLLSKRLKENPTATISLKGCENSDEFTLNKGKLAKKRAESIRDILVSSYGIDSKRISIVENSVPSKKSNENTKEGSLENSRVELYSTNSSILAPIEIADTVSKSTFSGFKVDPVITSEDSDVQWSVKTETNEKQISSEQGKIPTTPTTVPFTKDIISNISKASSLKITVNGEDSYNQTFESVLEIPIEKKFVLKQNEQTLTTTNITKEVYNLLLFDFNSSQLTDEQKKSLSIIKDRISPRSKVVIKGYTDKSGSEEVNKTLSLNRAKTVANVLGVGDRAEILGVGSSESLFPNEIPEGRFYSRTVVVEISNDN